MALALTAVLAAEAFSQAIAISTQASDPTAEVKETVNQILDVLHNNQMPLKEKREKLRSIVADHFDFRAMARSSVGYHWRSLNETQRQQFRDVFTNFIEDAYIGKIQGYQGQQVEFINRSFPGPENSEVDTRILQQGRDPISVKYALQQQNGQWMVYDVAVDNISIIAN
jgi:phospholipid transport system substrate-binding protein